MSDRDCAAAVEGHHFAGLDFVGRNGTFMARCACGWTSEPMRAAGLAHSAHDRHCDEQRPR